MTEQFSNFATTTLNGAINSAVTSLVVTSATPFPSSAQYRITIDSEIMIVTAGAGTTTWTVTRGAESTTAASHSNGAAVSHTLTAGSLGTVSQGQLGVFSVVGAVATSTGAARLRFPLAATILGVSLAITTAPTGAAILVDINKNGTTIFTTQGNRPTIAISGTAGAEGTAPDVTAYAAGDYLTVDVDQVGSTIAGSDLSVIVRWAWA